MEMVVDGSSNEETLARNRASLAPWLHAEDYTALPEQLRLGVVQLLSEALATADSPHTRTCSFHLMEDILALSSYGMQYLASRDRNKCTLERIEKYRSIRDHERRRLDATAANLLLTWRCQRFPTYGMPPLELNTSEYLIPEVQALQVMGGSVVKLVTDVNEDALRVEIKRYSKTLRRRVEVRQQELVRELQRYQRERMELRDQKKLGFRKSWAKTST